MLLLSFISVLFAQEHKTTVAVLDFEGQGISEVEASILANRFRSELVNTQSFLVIERGQMDEVMQEMGFQQSGCTSSECLVQIGKILNVKNMIGGSIGKFGSVYAIDLRMIDVGTGQIIKTITEDHHGEMTDLLQVIKTIAFRFSSSKIDNAQVKITGFGKIQINSTPSGAIVYIDEKKVGNTPYLVEKMKIGDYKLRLQKRGYQDYEGSLVVLEEKLTEISSTLLPFYQLSVFSEPDGADIFINGESLGKTPFNKQMTKGIYEILVKKSNFVDWSKKIELNQSGKVTAQLQLTPEYRARIDASTNKQQEPESIAADSDGGGSTWLWVGIGAAAIGGTAAILLSQNKDTGTDTGPQQPVYLPDPPSRP
jgi:TolB-like protein